jgi:hypothetical protein
MDMWYIQTSFHCLIYLRTKRNIKLTVAEQPDQIQRECHRTCYHKTRQFSFQDNRWLHSNGLQQFLRWRAVKHTGLKPTNEINQTEQNKTVLWFNNGHGNEQRNNFYNYCVLCTLSNILDLLYGLVVTVPGYRARGLGLLPSATRFSEK